MIRSRARLGIASRSFTRITASQAPPWSTQATSAHRALYYPGQGTAGLAPHRVREILLIMSDHLDHVVDISSTFDRKVRAVREHASQFGRHPDLEGFLRGLATRAGAAFGVPLAESFKRLAPS